MPPNIIIPMVFVGFVSYLIRKQFGKNNGGLHNSTLLACGLVAGSALMGVVLAVPFILAGNSDVLRLMNNSVVANILVVAVIFLLCVWLYVTSNSANKNYETKPG